MLDCRNHKPSSMLVLGAIGALIVGLPTLAHADRLCHDSGGAKTDCSGASGTCVCAERAGTVLFNNDVSFTFGGGGPTVTFISPSDTWKVWAQDGATTSPVDLGAIMLDPANDADSYKIAIKNGISNGSGASNVGSCDLSAVPLGTWSGYSSLNGEIDGNIAGDLIVLESGASGGALSLVIGGYVNGSVDAFKVESMSIDGSNGSNLSVTSNLCADAIETLLNVEYSIGGSMTIGDIDGELNVERTVEGDIIIDTLDGEFFLGDPTLDPDFTGDMTITNVDGYLEFYADLTGASQTITIENIDSCGDNTVNSFLLANEVGSDTTIVLEGFGTIANLCWLNISNDKSGQCEGRIEIEDDLPEEINLFTYSALDGVIDLNGNDAHSLAWGCDGGMSSDGEIIDAGIVDSPFFFLTAGVNHEFAGSADVDQIDSGVTVVCNNDFDGTLTVSGTMAGDVEISGDLTATGIIDLDGSVSGDIDIDGEHGGQISLGNGTTLSGTITVGEDVISTGDIFAKALSSTGQIHIIGDHEGDLETADCSGEINIDGDLASAGFVGVKGSLATTGRVIVDGLLAGELNIDEQTGAGSQIKANDGLDGKIIINSSQGDFGAHGAIYVGQIGNPNSFTGCILVQDNGSGNYGDLGYFGSISVLACTTTLDYDICIDGSINGSINLPTGCSGITSYSCQGNCEP